MLFLSACKLQRTCLFWDPGPPHPPPTIHLPPRAFLFCMSVLKFLRTCLFGAPETPASPFKNSCIRPCTYYWPRACWGRWRRQAGAGVPSPRGTASRPGCGRPDESPPSQSAPPRTRLVPGTVQVSGLDQSGVLQHQLWGYSPMRYTLWSSSFFWWIGFSFILQCRGQASCKYIPQIMLTNVF